MTDPLDIGPDTGLRELWLFSLFVTADELARWEPPRPGSPARDWPLEAALGAGPLDPAHVQVFEAGDLGPGGLRRYLADAHGMDAGQVDADAGKLDALRGAVVLVLSGALSERPGRFSPGRPLKFVGRYSARQSLSPATPHRPSASTTGHIAPAPAPAPATRRPLILTIFALIVLAALVLALV
jgi:hypothetical protein